MLLKFSAPMGAGAATTSSYKITKAGTTTSLRVKQAAVGSDPSRVTLTTAAQSSVGYLVKAADLATCRRILLLYETRLRELLSPSGVVLDGLLDVVAQGLDVGTPQRS